MAVLSLMAFYKEIKMKFILLISFFIVSSVWARDPRLTGKPQPERTQEMPCYRTEQEVKGDNRMCIWKCRDGSIESVTTPKQFQCPSVLFKRKGFE
jgi:hypothetical protein